MQFAAAHGDILIKLRRQHHRPHRPQSRKMKWEHRDEAGACSTIASRWRTATSRLFANGCNIATLPCSRVIELDPRTRKTVWEYAGGRATLLQPAYQRGAATVDRQHPDLRDSGGDLRGHPAGDIVWGICEPVHGADRNGDPSNEVFAPIAIPRIAQVRKRVRALYA